jgi:sulfate permease, SulP family
VRRNIKYIVFRLKRVRNPDVVALEVLDRFLQDVRQQGLTVLLAGVRPPLFEALTQIGITRYYPQNLIF